MNNDTLMHNLAKLGLPMFEPSADIDVDSTLAEVVKSDDMRLWELFPVLLARAFEDYRFTPEKVSDMLSSPDQKSQLHHLYLLSTTLYSWYHMNLNWSARLKKLLPEEEKALLKTWRNCLAHDLPIVWQDREFSSERLKKSFQLYVEQSAEKTRRRKERYEEFSLAYALSKVFSPKQADLFKRRLEGLPMTKTEQEYYSRSVKKKVVALANSELHSMARKLLEQ
jgi:hypothetical protein